MRRFRSTVLGAGCALVVLLTACGSGGGGSNGNKPGGSGVACTGGNGKKLTVGVSGAFTENILVAEMYSQALQNCGFTVDDKLSIGSREISDAALQKGEIDLKPEYLSSELAFVDPSAPASGDPATVAARLRPLLQKKGIALLDYSPATDQNVLVVTADTASKYHLQTVSDLAPVAGKLTLGGPPECPKRPYCLVGLKKVYGVKFGDFKALDTGGPQTVEALDAGAIDVGLLFSTNPIIQTKGWVVLKDDKGLQSAENIAPVVRRAVLDNTIKSALDKISQAMTTSELTQLIARVDLQREDVSAVAKSFLQDHNLL
ncbi:MAG: ABC transporter substrate-binding protein [Actinomycetota bacterium]|nr:ABC transporter substrate-binding protein [Actinomycetota bacterium]